MELLWIWLQISLRYLKGIPHSRYTLNKALFKVQKVLGPAFLAREQLERKRYFLLKEHANSEAKD